MMSAAEKPIYSLSTGELFAKLATSEKGLSPQEAEKRLGKIGPNKLTEKKKISAFQIFIRQFQNILTIILLIAAVLTFFVYFFGGKESSDLIEGSLILAIVALIAILGFLQEYRAEKAIEELKKLLAFKAKVLRDGRKEEVDVSNLIPGDIVILEEGEKVPADTRLIEDYNLQTNEASLTGESNSITKTSDPLSGNLQTADQKNVLFSGTVVASGRGVGVVFSTGDRTEIGKIASFVAETKPEKTPVQKRLDKLGRVLGYGTTAACAFVFVFIFFFARDFAHLDPLQRLLSSFIASIALAVAAIPEGLPAVVTVSLAFGTQRMLRRNALVRRLASMETLGSVDVICTDKTGTLTAGEMTVRQIYVDRASYTVTGQGYNLDGAFLKDGKKVETEELSLILKAGLACNNATFNSKEGKITGDPTEGALIVASHKARFKESGPRLHEEPFSSERKMMSVVVSEDGKKIIYTKGAPEAVLNTCTKVIKDGKEVSLTKEEKSEILSENSKMAAASLRVLGFAYKEIEKLEKDKVEEDLTFIGLQGMMDPPRKEVQDLISQCQASGIRVIMITGDQPATAKAVAVEIGVEGALLTGDDLEKLSESEFSKRVEDTNIYARVNPIHKFKIVEALKKKGHLVAMTGDGVNDAPALKKADIGIAMGITGTDVAKESADIVLLDDQFKTIVAAIEEGRGIFDNIRKFVDYLLSCNVGEVLVVFFGLLIFKDVLLTAVMLLWINVVTDGLPAIALGLDPAEKGILKFSPKKFQGDIINSRVWWEIAAFATTLTVAILALFFANLPEGVNEARAAVFTAIVIFEIIRLVNIRADYKIAWRDNILLIVAVVSSVALQLIVVYTPLLANLFGLSPIDAGDWLYIIFVSVGLLVLFKFFDGLLDKFAPVIETN